MEWSLLCTIVDVRSTRSLSSYNRYIIVKFRLWNGKMLSKLNNFRLVVGILAELLSLNSLSIIAPILCVLQVHFFEQL